MTDNPWEIVDASGIVSSTKDVMKERKENLQREVDKLAKEANRRLDELKANEMESPVYSQWVQNGSIRFGVQGKTYQQVQSEYWRTKNFLDAKTSTVQGAKEVLNQIASNTGQGRIYTQNQAKRYFDLASKVSDYYKMTGESAKALDYQKIWHQVNLAIDRGQANLDRANYTVNEIADIANEIGQINDELKMLNAMPDNSQGVEAMANAPNNTTISKIGNKVKGVATAMANAVKGVFKALFGRK